MLSELIVGPRASSDGTQVPQRAAKDGTTVVTDAHGRYYEATYRGRVWSYSTPYAGATLVAASAIGQSAWAPLVGLFNPAASGVNLIILAGFANYISGTPTAGGIVWGFVAPSAGVTAAGSNGAVNMGTLATGGSTAKTFTVGTAMTGSAASAILFPFPASAFAGAIAATTPLGSIHQVDGAIIVPPGGAVGITGTLGTATLLQGGLIWEEQPV